MNNNGNFNNGPPSALMSYPFPMHNPPLIDPAYTNQIPQHFQTHATGFYNPRPQIQSPKSEKRKQEILTCDACGIEVNSQQMMDAHIRGQKHIKKMKLKAVSTTSLSSNQTSENTDVDQKPSLPPPVESLPTTITEPIPSIEPTPPQTTITKPSSSIDKSVLQSLNELAKFNKVISKYDLIKETGPAHCKQFEVQLTLGDETYTGIGTSIKRAQQVAAEQALATTTLKKVESTQRSSHPSRTSRGGINRGMHSNIRHQYPLQPNRQKSHPVINHQQQQSNENLFQNLIEKKSSEIIENDETIFIVHRLVDDIERALKTVSDKIMEQCRQNNIRVVPQLPDNVTLNNIEQTNEDPTEAFRMLKGAMKVSTLAMRLFYKHDYEYSLVLICANKPTVTLLNDICQELTIGLNAQAIAAIQLDSNDEQSTPITYDIKTHINDACVTVQCSLIPKYIIRIMLTSPVFRSENFLNLEDAAREQIAELNPDPSDMLDKIKCLEAAAEIRHSNWFTRCMSENNTNLIVLRLLRDLQYNKTPLSLLNLWCLSLIVYKCQIQPINSIVHLFRSVFACLSSGILLPNNIGPGIIDPCEKELIDATATYLTIEQRLNITNYANYIFRSIVFDKYENIFHYESIQPEQTSINSTLGNINMD